MRAARVAAGPPRRAGRGLPARARSRDAKSHAHLVGVGGDSTPGGPALQTPPGLAVAANPETWILPSSTLLQTSILTLLGILEKKPCQSGARGRPTIQIQAARVASRARTE